MRPNGRYRWRATVLVIFINLASFIFLLSPPCFELAQRGGVDQFLAVSLCSFSDYPWPSTKTDLLIRAPEVVGDLLAYFLVISFLINIMIALVWISGHALQSFYRRVIVRQ